MWIIHVTAINLLSSRHNILVLKTLETYSQWQMPSCLFIMYLNRKTQNHLVSQQQKEVGKQTKIKTMKNF